MLLSVLLGTHPGLFSEDFGEGHLIAVPYLAGHSIDRGVCIEQKLSASVTGEPACITLLPVQQELSHPYGYGCDDLFAGGGNFQG